MKSIRNARIHPSLGDSLGTGIALALAALVLAGCGARGPEYGADSVERKALAIPPDLAAEPLAVQNPYPDLPDVSRFRPGPQPDEKGGDWAARIKGNTLNAPVPEGWALGTVRAALLMQGAGIAEERQGVLRTSWLGEAALDRLGVPSSEAGRIRFTVKTEPLSAGRGTRVTVQGTVREGEDVRRAEDKPVTKFLLAVQPAFGKRR